MNADINIDLMEHLLKSSDARQPKVRVTYRVKGQQQATSRTLTHRHYLEFARDLDVNGYELLEAGQVREE